MKTSVNQLSLSALVAAAFLLLLAGCEKESENTANNAPVAARITSVIDSMATRAAGTAWAPGDNIGIYATDVNTAKLCTNAPYVTPSGDGTFIAKGGGGFYFQDKGDVTFTAYYPFAGENGTAPGTGGVIGKTIAATDQAPANRPQIDYLFADFFTASSARPNVQFVFRHCMSRIVLKFLPGNGVASLDDIEYTLGGIHLAGKFDTRTGSATADVATPAAPLTLSVPVSGSTATELTSELILFPQQGNDDKTLTLKMRGTDYAATFKLKENPANPGVRELLPAHSYTYNVTINNATMTISSATIADWADGGSQNGDATTM